MHPRASLALTSLLLTGGLGAAPESRRTPSIDAGAAPAGSGGPDR